MGVNISTWLCLKWPDGTVHDVGQGPCISRDYILYGLMGGVRGPRTLFEPRGAPEGATATLRTFMELAGTRYHSWLTTAELEQVANAYLTDPSLHEGGTLPTLLDASFAATLGAMRALDEWCEKRGTDWAALLAFGFG